jgi:multidrug efflux pump subunit AcrA (membrane-fusion protein)
MKARAVIILVFAVCLTCIGLVALVRARQLGGDPPRPRIEPVAVQCQTLEPQAYDLTEEFFGLLEANAQIEMSFRLEGQITHLGIKKRFQVNQRIEQGVPVAGIKPAEQEAMVRQAKANELVSNAALESAEAKLNQAKAGQRSADAAIADAKAQLADAKVELEQMQKLAADGSAQPREVDKTKLLVVTAQAALDRAEAALDVAKADVQDAGAKIRSANAQYSAMQATRESAQLNLDKTTLLTPKLPKLYKPSDLDSPAITPDLDDTWTIAEIPHDIGQTVKPGQLVVRLVDLRSIKLVVGVVENKIPLLKRGQKVKVDVFALTSQAGKLSNSGKLSEIQVGTIFAVPPAADPVTGLFNVEILLPNEDRILRPGMVAKAIVSVAQKRAFAVPAEAVSRSGQKLRAFFVTEGYSLEMDLGALGKKQIQAPVKVARQIMLTPLASHKEYFLVTDLPKGMNLLVIRGQSRLSDGQAVKLLNAPSTQTNRATGPATDKATQ